MQLLQALLLSGVFTGCLASPFTVTVSIDSASVVAPIKFSEFADQLQDLKKNDDKLIEFIQNSETIKEMLQKLPEKVNGQAEKYMKYAGNIEGQPPSPPESWEDFKKFLDIPINARTDPFFSYVHAAKKSIEYLDYCAWDIKESDDKSLTTKKLRDSVVSLKDSFARYKKSMVPIFKDLGSIHDLITDQMDMLTQEFDRLLESIDMGASGSSLLKLTKQKQRARLLKQEAQLSW